MSDETKGGVFLNGKRIAAAHLKKLRVSDLQILAESLGYVIRVEAIPNSSPQTMREKP